MSEPYQLPPDTPDPMYPYEVAAVYRVDPKTVSRWADQGLLDSIHTLGGHRRIPLAAMQKALRDGYSPRRTDAPRPHPATTRSS